MNLSVPALLSGAGSGTRPASALICASTFPPSIFTPSHNLTLNLNLNLNRSSARTNLNAPSAFTLIELVLVMALLVIVIAISMPSLSGFFRGRNLDAEARQFISLVRYGQSRAVSEGVPVVLWISAQRRSYGLEVQPGFLSPDPRALEIKLGDGLDVEVSRPVARAQTLTPQQQTLPGLGYVPMIRFLPTGFISETSPELIILRQGDRDAIWIAPSATRLSYEIQSNPTGLARR